MFPQLADKSHWRCVKGENQSRFYAGACVTFSSLQVRWLEEERRVEWHPDGSHNKTVIERYVIVTISSCGKWYQRDIPAEKEDKKGNLF